MTAVEAKLLTISLIVAPLVLWFALFTLARMWSVDLRPLVPWLRGLRWAVWLGGMVLWARYFAGVHFQGSWGIPCAVLAFAAGLSLPERWLKHRIQSSKLVA